MSIENINQSVTSNLCKNNNEDLKLNFNIKIDRINETKNLIKIHTKLTDGKNEIKDCYNHKKSLNIDNFAEEFAKLNLLIKNKELLNISNEVLNAKLENLCSKLPEDKFEFVQCFNSQSVLDSETKVLILGSITSISGVKNGYFYTSDRNQAMTLLDCVIQSNGRNAVFENAKKQLILARKNCKNTEKLVNNLKFLLKNEKIAFLDVIDCCIRPNNNSDDQSIIISVPYSEKLLYEKLKNSNVKAIFSNSQFVDKYFMKKLGGEKLIKNLNITYEKIMSPSPRSKKNIEVKKQNWCEKISKFLV